MDELNRRLIVRQKILPAELGSVSQDLILLRHLADYKSQSITAKGARRAVEQARKFLAAVAGAIGETV
jgi:hypothetical protein